MSCRFEQEIDEWSELYPNAELNLEFVFAYSHRKHFLQLIGSDEHFSHGSRSIVAARHAIQAILTELTPYNVPTLYEDFVKRLTPNDTLLTFNYDTLLEDALETVGTPYSLTPEWWLSGQESDDIDEKYKAHYVDVLKLHGDVS